MSPGYGNLTPKTTLGRVVTIVYAVIGIPMTLLCLTNIGSFMARCFRLLWKQIVCKPCRKHLRRRTMYQAAKRKAATAAYIGKLAKQTRDGTRDGVGAGVPSADGRPQSYGRGDEGASDSPAAVHDSVSLLWKSGANSSSLPSGNSRYLMGYEGLMTGESVSNDLHEQQQQHVQPGSASNGKTRTPTSDRSPFASSNLQALQYPASPDPGGKPAAENERPPITVTMVNQSDLDLDPDELHGKLKTPPPKTAQPEVVRVPILSLIHI